MYIQSRVKKYFIHQRQLEDICKTLLSLLDLSSSQFQISFVGKKRIQNLNAQWRKKDKPTDVLSFPMIDFSKPLVPKLFAKKNFLTHAQELGDLVICLDVCAVNAKALSQSLSREVVFMVVHGVLHLVGYDHIEKNDEKLMRKKQQEIMKILARKFQVDSKNFNLIRKKKLK